jgi:two-component system sensor histidine kinase VicK
MLAPDQQVFCQMGAVSSDGYFIYSIASNTFSYINPAFCGIFGLTAEEISINPAALLEHVHPEDKVHVSHCYNELLEDRGFKKYVFRAVCGDDEKYLKVSVFISESGKEITGIVEDFTVAQQNKIHIEQINARKNVTLEVLSHDLKEPLAMIRMAATSIENRIADVKDDTVKNSLKFIADLCERNIRLVRSMVNHEFLKSSVVAIKKERADLVWELMDVVRFYNRSHLGEVREFRFSSVQEKIYLFIDSMKFLQVINNLISNSIKFTPIGGIIEVHAEDRGDTVVIKVSDDGIGIPEEIRNNLFHQNRKILRKGLNGEESGGLGMGIIKDIVDLHNGRIWVVSEEGMGTEFFIELPKK